MIKPAKILIADDQSLYREGLAELFKRWSEFVVVGQAADGREAIDMCKRLRPDIAILDVKMPIMDGIEACGILQKDCPETSVVILSLYAEKERVLGAIANGANGYLLKSIHAIQLHSKLLAVLKGGAVLSDEVVPICFDALRKSSFVIVDEDEMARQLASLTEHEKDVLRCIAIGASNKEIGDELFVSESTIKKQLSTLLIKLGLSNRVQAAVFALRSGLAR